MLFYIRYLVSYQAPEDVIAERGVIVNHGTLNRWVVKYAPLIANEARNRKTSGANPDFTLSEAREYAAATDFSSRTLGSNGAPNRYVVDKDGANKARKNKVNDFIGHDHCFIKRLTRQIKGHKSFRAASATLAGIEVAHMIRNDQFDAKGKHAFQHFAPSQPEILQPLACTYADKNQRQKGFQGSSTLMPKAWTRPKTS